MPCTFLRRVLFVILLATFTNLSSAADLPRYTIHRVDSKIVVDGKLNEPAWRNAKSVGAFKFAWWKSGQREQTDARILWDDKYLYVSYACADAYVSATETEHDSAVYRDDCVELFTAPNPQRPNDYFNIEMNVNRAILDRHHPNGPGKSQVPNWNSKGIVIATQVNGTLNDDSDKDRGWDLEVAIPFANFAHVTGKPRPIDGDVWHLNLNRLGGKTNKQYSQWSPGTTAQPAFHAPDTFGRVKFSGLTTEDDALKSLAAVGYRPIPDFLKLPSDVKLGACSAVAINSKDELFLFHRGAQPILCFDAAGRFLRSWGDDLIGSAHGLRIDTADNVWVTDTQHHMVFKFNSTGKLLLALGTSDRPGAGSDSFNKPTDIAFGPLGEIFVTDGYKNTRVVKFDRRGKYLTAWGTPGKKPGEFNLPHSIAIDSKQRVIVGDRENDRIQVFDLSGRRIAVWPGFVPYGIALDTADQVFVADGRAHQVLRLNAKGEVQQRFGTEGFALGQFYLPHMLAVAKDGSIYIAEIGGERLQKFQPIK